MPLLVPRTAWSLVRRETGKSEPHNDIVLREGGQLLVRPHEVADRFAAYFSVAVRVELEKLGVVSADGCTVPVSNQRSMFLRTV